MVNVTAYTSTIMEAIKPDYQQARKGKFVRIELNLHWVSFAIVLTYWSETE